ncbi:MAG: hypothetical protein PHS46_06505 [Candidatus Omnitrophica bacterium]|nr:hypothetical protein [Candidatus Omnitrophota bacterium]
MVNGHASAFTSRVALSAILYLIVGAFAFSLFKNIQYPILWNDESETAMYAKRILQYGYPKIHDGKNIVWLSELPDKEIGIDKRWDAPTSLVWGQYYFAAIGEVMAEKTHDIYLKTALLRMPFAFAGFLGLIVMALSVTGLFGKDAVKRLFFLIIFFSFILSSVALTLHFREVRHPALVVFLSAVIFYLYFNYRFYGKLKIILYSIGLTLSLFLLYNVFHVPCFIFLAVIGLYELIILMKKRNIRSFLGGIAPLFAALILIMPFIIFSRVLEFGKAYKVLYSSSMPSWLAQISDILSFFHRYEFLYLVLIAKAGFFYGWAYSLRAHLNPSTGVRQKMWVSNFLSLFFIIFVLTTALFPHPIIYERYYIVLVPVIAIMISLDILGAFELFSAVRYTSTRICFKWIFAGVLLLVLMTTGSDRIDHMKGHVYELLHRYKGPLDFAIPFIKSNYRNTESLTIATNYEELAYMYYLDSKVIIGFVGNNLHEDSKLRPDVVIFRKTRSSADLAVFNNFLLSDKYEKISFPVFDYFVNNIPELRHHLYLTPLSDEKNKNLDIFIKSTGGAG